MSLSEMTFISKDREGHAPVHGVNGRATVRNVIKVCRWKEKPKLTHAFNMLWAGVSDCNIRESRVSGNSFVCTELTKPDAAETTRIWHSISKTVCVLLS